MTDDLMIGRILGGRYQVQSVIGRGGMASVYQAFDTNLRRTVAVKVIHPYYSDNPDFVRRFEDEATLVAQFHHPNIPVIYDFSHDDDIYYIVMEYVAGESLEKRLKNLAGVGQSLPVAVAVQYLAELCAAADYAHQRGVVHRDIKPANIIIDLEDRPHLMDFGIAKIVGGQKHTATGLAVGSAHYMAPEQIQGLMLDGRVDIYALGATLFEMLSGRPPFEADSAMTLMMMHLNDPLPDIRELRPDVPPEVAATILKAMAKARDERFRSAAEMASALLHGPAQPAHPTPVAVQQQRPPLESTRLEVAVAAAPLRQASSPADAAARQPQPVGSPTRPPGQPAAPAFPQTPQESLYPVSKKRSPIWLVVLALLVIALMVGGGYVLFVAKPAAQNPAVQNSAVQSSAILPTAALLAANPTGASPLAGQPTQSDATALPPTAIPTAADAVLPTAAPSEAPLAAPTAPPAATPTAEPGNSGFVDNCIDSNTWTPYKLSGISEENGCWNLAHWGMAAENAELSISMPDMVNASERSIYRPLAGNSLIRLIVKINQLNTLSTTSDGLAFGIGKPETWQEAGRFILFRRTAASSNLLVFLAGGVKNAGSQVLEAGLGDEIELEIVYQDGEVTFSVNGVELDGQVALPAGMAANPVFSIGYSLPAGGSLQAVVSDLAVAER